MLHVRVCVFEVWSVCCFSMCMSESRVCAYVCDVCEYVSNECVCNNLRFVSFPSVCLLSVVESVNRVGRCVICARVKWVCLFVRMFKFCV